MGSYSQSCGLSGLEIAQGEDAFVCILMQQHSPINWGIAVPPLRGYYDDYGYLVIDEADRPLAEAFGIDVSSREWSPLEYEPDALCRKPTEYQWVLPMWVHSRAFDTAPSLIRDYSDTGRNGTIGDDTDEHLVKVTEMLSELSQKEDGSDALDDDLRSIRNFLNEVQIDQVIGSRPVLENFSTRAVAALNAGQPVDLLIEAYRRAFILETASFELRRPLIGQNGSHGPQHGGERAAAEFTQMVLSVSKQRIEEREDDDI